MYVYDTCDDVQFLQLSMFCWDVSGKMLHVAWMLHGLGVVEAPPYAVVANVSEGALELQLRPQEAATLLEAWHQVLEVPVRNGSYTGT